MRNGEDEEGKMKVSLPNASLFDRTNTESCEVAICDCEITFWSLDDSMLLGE